MFNIFKSKSHFNTVCTLCKQILGCNIKTTNSSSIEYFDSIRRYFDNPHLINSEKFLIATEVLLKTFRSDIILTPINLDKEEKRVGHMIENTIANICIKSDDDPIKCFIWKYIKSIFPEVIILGICPTFDGPCNDISFLLELNGQKFILPIEIKSTNRYNMSYLGDRCLTGPCGMVFVVGYDFMIKDNDLKITSIAIIPWESANEFMKKTINKKKIFSSNSYRYIHNYIDINREYYLQSKNRWYGQRPSLYDSIMNAKRYNSNQYNNRYNNNRYNNNRYNNNRYNSSNINWRQRRSILKSY